MFGANKELESSRWSKNMPAETPFKFAKERVLLNYCLVEISSTRGRISTAEY
jgi:hypothetical protein